MIGSYLVYFFLLAGFQPLETVHLTINISGIETGRGVLQIAFFDSEMAYENEKPIFTKTIPKNKLKNGKLTCTFDISPGNYGVTALDDEDGDGKMKYNRLRLPREGFGFGNYESKGCRKPSFSDFAMQLNRDTATLTIKLRYFL